MPLFVWPYLSTDNLSARFLANFELGVSKPLCFIDSDAVMK